MGGVRVDRDSRGWVGHRRDRRRSERDVVFVGFGLVFAAFFGWCAWAISPPAIRRRNPDLVQVNRDRLNRLFLRLHFTWAVDPAWREKYEQERR
jgi:hypothetical protein